MMHKLSPFIMQHYVFIIKLKAVHRINFVVGQSLQLASLSAFDLALAPVAATFQLHVSCWMSLILLQVFSLYCCIPQIVRFFLLFFDKTDNLWIKFYFSAPNFRHLKHSSEPNLITCTLKSHFETMNFCI